MFHTFLYRPWKMAPKKRTRWSTKTAESGEEINRLNSLTDGPCLWVLIELSADYCINTTGKDESGEVSPVESDAQTVRGKRKASTASEKTRKPPGTKGDKSLGHPQHNRWLMKSEPESRFENGIDVKVQLCLHQYVTIGLGRLVAYFCFISSCSGPVGCTLLICVYFVFFLVWDRGSEGSAQSDWMLGWCPQLSGSWSINSINHRMMKIVWRCSLPDVQIEYQGIVFDGREQCMQFYSHSPWHTVVDI